MSEKQETGSSAGAMIGTLLVAAAAFGMGWMASMMFKPAEKEDPAAAMAAARGPLTVGSAVAELREINPPETFVGHVEPTQDVDLRVQVDGYLASVNFKEGSFVKEGDLLFAIDDEIYQARVAQRKAELERSKAELERAELYHKRLTAADKRSFAQTEMDTAHANVLQAKASISQAEANLRQSEIDLKHTKLLAPISGRIGPSLAKKGDYVAPSMGALARIVQVDPIRVVFSVMDRDYVRMAEEAKQAGEMPKLRARLLLPTKNIYQEEGTMDFFNNEMSKETPTLAVRYSFPNANGILVPNTYVTMILDRADVPKVLTVPHLAVLIQKDKNAVYVVRDGKAIEQEVKLGQAFNGFVEITEGLQAGDEVVTDGVHKIQRSGMPVKVANLEIK